MPTGFLERDLDLPASHVVLEHLWLAEVLIGREQGLRLEAALGVADQQPADRQRWLAGVIPQCLARADLDEARTLAIA